MSRISDPRDILLAPVISEKSYGLLDENKYTFIVSPDANKTQIKIAVEQVFGVGRLDLQRHQALIRGRRRIHREAIVAGAGQPRERGL